MRRLWRGRAAAATVVMSLAAAGCGSTTILHHSPSSGTLSEPATPAPAPATVPSSQSLPAKTSAPEQLGFPYLATKNTTRVAGNDPISDAAAVALATFPSTAAGTHPTAVTLAPADDWQAAVAAASLMGAPFRAPMLLSGPGSLPTATANALGLLAPTGDAAAAGAHIIRVGDVPPVPHLTGASIVGSDPYTLAANIDLYEANLRHRESTDVVIAPAQDPADAMPAAGWAAESGEPILYVNSEGVPAATASALRRHHHAHIFVLGPPSAIPQIVVDELSRYGVVHRIGAATAAAESVAFAEYRDPPCTYGQQCVHIPRSFGWAIRSPGHGYVLINETQPLAAAAAAALSASGGFGPQLLVSGANTLPQAVLNYFLNFATPGYTAEGPTAAVYNHAWLIGNAAEISEAVQAQVDSILEVVRAR